MVEKFLNTSGRHRFLINFHKEGGGEAILIGHITSQLFVGFPPKDEQRVRGNIKGETHSNKKP